MIYSKPWLDYWCEVLIFYGVSMAGNKLNNINMINQLKNFNKKIAMDLLLGGNQKISNAVEKVLGVSKKVEQTYFTGMVRLCSEKSVKNIQEACLLQGVIDSPEQKKILEKVIENTQQYSEQILKIMEELDIKQAEIREELLISFKADQKMRQAEAYQSVREDSIRKEKKEKVREAQDEYQAQENKMQEEAEKNHKKAEIKKGQKETEPMDLKIQTELLNKIKELEAANQLNHEKYVNLLDGILDLTKKHNTPINNSTFLISDDRIKQLKELREIAVTNRQYCDLSSQHFALTLALKPDDKKLASQCITSTWKVLNEEQEQIEKGRQLFNQWKASLPIETQNQINLLERLEKIENQPGIVNKLEQVYSKISEDSLKLNSIRMNNTTKYPNISNEEQEVSYVKKIG